MSKWTRDNGIFRPGNSLCSGALLDTLKGNLVHYSMQCVTDITVPFHGPTLGGGVLINSLVAVQWMGVFSDIRPFAVPVKLNTDGAFRGMRFTFHLYYTGNSSAGKVRVYLSNRPPAVSTENRSYMWDEDRAAGGLKGITWRNYGDGALTAIMGEKVVDVNVTPVVDSVTQMYPEANRGDSDTSDYAKGPSDQITWVTIDAYVPNGDAVRFRALRVRDIPL